MHIICVNLHKPVHHKPQIGLHFVLFRALDYAIHFELCDPSSHHCNTHCIFSKNLADLLMNVNWFNVFRIKKMKYRSHFTSGGIFEQAAIINKHYKGHNQQQAHNGVISFPLIQCLPRISGTVIAATDKNGNGTYFPNGPLYLVWKRFSPMSYFSWFCHKKFKCCIRFKKQVITIFNSQLL